MQHTHANASIWRSQLVSKRRAGLLVAVALLFVAGMSRDSAAEPPLQFDRMGLEERVVVLHLIDEKFVRQLGDALPALERFIVAHAGVPHVLVVPGNEDTRNDTRALLAEKWRDRMLLVARSNNDTRRMQRTTITTVVYDADGEEVGRIDGATIDDIHLDRVSRLLREHTSHADAERCNATRSGVALGGRDVVSYLSGRPVEGAERYATWYRGLTYTFASAENRERFVLEPERYKPAYGGWCAWRMTKGDVAAPSLDSYLIDDRGRVLLFEKDMWGDARKSWNDGDPIELADEADAAWAKIIAGDN